MPRLTLVLALLIPFWSKFLTLKKDDQLANETFPVDFQDLRLGHFPMQHWRGYLAK